MKTFDVCLASQLTRQEAEHRWLIKELWGSDAVGTVGGEPKSYKSYLVLQMAVSVASGTPLPGSVPCSSQWPGPALCRRGCPPHGARSSGRHLRPPGF